jgi:hypothetical protein
LEEALAEYERQRNESALPAFELNFQFATLQPPPPEMQALFGALRGNQLDTDRFIATGIDGGARSHFVAAPEGRDTVSVREFGTVTSDLGRLADWLTQCGVTTVAMESTGVYWIPVYELVEARGFEALWGWMPVG